MGPPSGVARHLWRHDPPAKGARAALDRGPMRLNLVSWNIHFARTARWEPSGEAILAAIDGFGADVLCLQEAEERFGGRPSALPLHEIARRGWRPVRRAPGSGLGYRGNAILLRRGWKVDDVLHLPLEGIETRGALIARIRAPEGARLTLACVHLGLIGRHRRAQLRAVGRAMEGLAGPSAIVGDVNEWRLRARLPLPEGWSMHVPGKTFSTARPRFPLDRIMSGPGLAVEDARVLREGFDAAASDHFPVAATLVLPR